MDTIQKSQASQNNIGEDNFLIQKTLSIDLGDKDSLEKISNIEKYVNLRDFQAHFSDERQSIEQRVKQLHILGTKLSKLKQLRALRFNITQIHTDAKISAGLASCIKGNKNLQKLIILLFGSDLDNKELSKFTKAIPTCAKLTQLYISLHEPSYINDEDFESLGIAIAKCQNLQELVLTFGGDLNGQCLSQVGLALKGCKQLIKLSLIVPLKVNHKIIEDFGQHLQNYRNLIQFSIGIYLKKNQKNKLIRKIRKIPRLVCFSISDQDYVELDYEDFSNSNLDDSEEQSSIQQHISQKEIYSNDIDQENNNLLLHSNQEQNSKQIYEDNFNLESDRESNKNNSLIEFDSNIQDGDNHSNEQNENESDSEENDLESESMSKQYVSVNEFDSDILDEDNHNDGQNENENESELEESYPASIQNSNEIDQDIDYQQINNQLEEDNNSNKIYSEDFNIESDIFKEDQYSNILEDSQIKEENNEDLIQENLKEDSNFKISNESGSEKSEQISSDGKIIEKQNNIQLN